MEMDQVEDEIYVEKDDSRPFFQRQKCEVGIYMTVYTAKAKDEKSFGLEHFFRMRTTERLYDEFHAQETVDIRAQFVARNILHEMYINRFEPGIVMAVGFDSIKALDDLWEYHRQGKLTSLVHEILVTSHALQTADVCDVTLVTKLWDDEYDNCKEELKSRTEEILDITYRPHDIYMVERLKKYQQVLGVEVSKMRDLDNEMELNRTEFMNCVHNLLPNDQDGLKTLQEYESLAKSSKGRKSYNRDLLDLYSTIIQNWRTYYKTFELEVVTPLMQIHTICENEKQRATKSKIINHVREMQKMLEPQSSLQTISHPEMARKIIRRDCPVFLGLLSLVPIGVERVSDIDIMIDEYTREFKMEFKVQE